MMPQSEQESSIQLTTKTGAVRVNNIKCWIEFFDHIVREITVIPEENEKYKVANVKLVLPPERTKLVVVHWSSKTPISALCKVWVTAGANKVGANSARCVMSANVASTQIRSTEGYTTSASNLSIGKCLKNKKKSRITLEIRRVDNVDTTCPPLKVFEDMWCADVREGRRPYAKFIFLLDREDYSDDPQVVIHRPIAPGSTNILAVVPQEATEQEIIEISSSSSAPSSPNNVTDVDFICTPSVVASVGTTATNKKRTLETNHQREAMSLNKSRATKDGDFSFDRIIKRPKTPASSSTMMIHDEVRTSKNGQEREVPNDVHHTQLLKKGKICETSATLMRNTESKELRAPKNQPGAAPPPVSQSHCVASHPSSSDRRHQARVCLMETEPNLDPSQAVAMVDYFTETPEAADVYIDLKRSDIRKAWVRKRLAEMGYSQDK